MAVYRTPCPKSPCDATILHDKALSSPTVNAACLLPLTSLVSNIRTDAKAVDIPLHVTCYVRHNTSPELSEYVVRRTMHGVGRSERSLFQRYRSFAQLVQPVQSMRSVQSIQSFLLVLSVIRLGPQAVTDVSLYLTSSTSPCSPPSPPWPPPVPGRTPSTSQSPPQR